MPDSLIRSPCYYLTIQDSGNDWIVSGCPICEADWTRLIPVRPSSKRPPAHRRAR